MLTNVVDTADSSPLSAFLTKLKTQPMANGPFAIVANYLGQGSKAPLITYEPSTFLQESTREMAKKIVIHSLKTGSAHYNDLIDLLLEDKHPRVDLKREEVKAFGEKELTYFNRILP